MSLAPRFLIRKSISFLSPPEQYRAGRLRKVSESSGDERRTSDEYTSSSGVPSAAAAKPQFDRSDADYSDVFDSLTISIADAPYAMGADPVGGMSSHPVRLW